MSIVIRLDRMLVEHKMTLTELADRVGITVANLSILKTGKARAIRLTTLDAICRELDCQPGDVLEYIPGTGRTDHRHNRSIARPWVGNELSNVLRTASECQLTASRANGCSTIGEASR